MYKINEIGTWPIIDLGATEVSDTNSSVTIGALGGSVYSYLNTPNLGGNDYGYIHGTWRPGGQNFNHNGIYCFGVALRPLSALSTNKAGIPLEVSASLGMTRNGFFEPKLIIGTIDSGATLTNGHSTNNILTEVHVINMLGADVSQGYFSGNILLKNLLTDEVPSSDYVYVGVAIHNMEATGSNISLYQADFMVSARYALKNISTLGIN